MREGDHKGRPYKDRHGVGAPLVGARFIGWLPSSARYLLGTRITGAAFTGLLTSHGIAISIDGKGAWRDNVFVERLWKSIKYEEVYLHAYQSVAEARRSLGRYLGFYNGGRPHSSLDEMTPDHAYFNLPSLRAAA